MIGCLTLWLQGLIHQMIFFWTPTTAWTPLTASTQTISSASPLCQGPLPMPLVIQTLSQNLVQIMLWTLHS